MAVYFAQSKATGFIKIGYTKEALHRRLTKLESAWQQRVNCLGWISGGRPEEQELLKKFKRFHIRSEWFKPVPSLLAFIIMNAYRAHRPRPRTKAARIRLSRERERVALLQLRLPVPLYEAIAEASVKNDRRMSGEIRVALRKVYLDGRTAA